MPPLAPAPPLAAALGLGSLEAEWDLTLGTRGPRSAVPLPA